MRSIHIDHGNPMNAILDTPFTQALKNLGRSLEKPKRIIIQSAHYLTEGESIEIGNHHQPQVVYDMYGFPPALYEVEYSVNIDIEWVRSLGEIFIQSWIHHRLNPKRGIDHGIWSVLIHLFLDADISIIPISVPDNLPPKYHFHIGEILAKNFDDETLFISSGNIVHNLRMIDWNGWDTPEWARDFDRSIEEICQSGVYSSIIDYPELPWATFAVPTPDHLYPFITFMGTSMGKSIESTYQGFEMGSISTRIYQSC